MVTDKHPFEYFRSVEIWSSNRRPVRFPAAGTADQKRTEIFTISHTSYASVINHYSLAMGHVLLLWRQVWGETISRSYVAGLSSPQAWSNGTQTDNRSSWSVTATSIMSVWHVLYAVVTRVTSHWREVIDMPLRKMWYNNDERTRCVAPMALKIRRSFCNINNAFVRQDLSVMVFRQSLFDNNGR